MDYKVLLTDLSKNDNIIKEYINSQSLTDSDLGRLEFYLRMNYNYLYKDEARCEGTGASILTDLLISRAGIIGDIAISNSSGTTVYHSNGKISHYNPFEYDLWRPPKFSFNDNYIHNLKIDTFINDPLCSEYNSFLKRYY